jgi:dCMP deaminase
MLILDEDFKESYVTYYQNYSSFEVPKIAEAYLGELDNNIYTEVVNVIRTANTIGATYYKCYEEIAKRISFRLSTDVDLSLLVFNAVFFSVFHSDIKSLEHALGDRFAPRNFYADIAIAMYGNASPENIEKIKGNEGHYSASRPSPGSWDEWFYNMCLDVASNSKCHSRKIGADLVRDKRIISTGYNGPPRGVPSCDKRWKIDFRFAQKYKDKLPSDETSVIGVCPRRIIGFPSGQGLEICPAGHAERNALINAARHGIKTKGTSDEPTTLYMGCGIPCTPCLVEIMNAGVSEIVVSGVGFYDETAEYVLENSSLRVRLFNFLKK